MLKHLLSTVNWFKQRPTIQFGFIVFVNVIFRVFGTDSSSIYLDEGQTLFQVKKSLTDIIEGYVMQQQNAPLYFVLVHFWVKLFGLSVFSVRFFSVIMMALAGGVFFKLAKKLVSFEFGLIASVIFLGVNDFMHYAHEARGYALIAFLCVSSFYALYNLLNSEHKKWIYILVIVNIALLYTHYLTIYIFAAQGISVLIHLILFKDKSIFFKYVLSQVVVGILFAPWLGVVFSVMPEKGSFWIAEPTWNLLKNNYYYLIDGRLKTHIFFAALGFALVLKFFQKHNQNKEEVFKIALLILWSFLPVIANYFIGFHIPVFLAKYTFYASLGFVLLSVYLLYTLSQTRWVGLTLVVAMGFFAFKSLNWFSHKGESWKSAVAHIKNLEKTDSTIIIGQRFYTYKPFYVYYNLNFFKSSDRPFEEGQKFNIYFKESKQQVEQLTNNKNPDRVIYFRSHWRGNDPNGTIKSYLDANYTLVSEKKYVYRYNKETIGVYEYEKH